MKHTFNLLFSIVLIMLCSAKIQAQIITTYAGTGSPGTTGDGGAATAAQISNPYAVAVDAAGNAYIADVGASRVRKVSAAGIITTFAGGGSGVDGSPASTASLAGPIGVAVDAAGNVYISEYSGNKIRKVNTAGIISTFVTGLSTPVGIAVDPSGNLFIANQNAYKVMKVTPAGVMTTYAGTGVAGFSGDGFPATNATMNGVTGVAADPLGNVYFCCSGDSRVRMVNSAGIISTVAGTGVPGFSGDGGPATAAQLNQPYGMCADASGNVYIADNANYRIRKIDVTTGLISTVVGTGTATYNGDNIPAVTANITPFHVFVSAAGNMYVTDAARIRFIAPCIGTVPVVAPITGPASLCAASTITLADVTPGGVWSSSSPALATVSSLGVVTGLAAGSLSISYTVTNGCGSTSSVQALTVNITPAPITITPNSATSLCLGSNATFTANSSIPIPILSQDFNSGMTGSVGGTWTISNLGDASPYNWGIRTPGGLTDVPTLTGDGSNFLGADADLAGGTVHINTVLNSPSFSTVGYPAATLTFNHYCYSQLPYDVTVDIEYSIDGGGSWNVLTSYLGTTTSPPVGTVTWSAGSPTQTIPLPPAAIGQPNVMLKWTYNSTFGWYWGIDNIAVSASTVPPFTWSGIAGASGLSCTSCATTTITPAAAGINVYSVTATAGGCSTTSGVSINVNPGSAGDPLSGPIAVCPGNVITLTTPLTGGSWTSSNPGIATVDGAGNVTGVSAGNAIISYSLSGSCGPIASMGLVTVGQPVITTVAGSGVSGYTGDGGPATAARLSSPIHLTKDAAGNVYFADYNNNVIRKVTPSGVISTVAGTAALGYNGDNIPASSAMLNRPNDVAVDAAGNLYIADRYNNRVRKVSTTGIITTIAGTGTAGYSGDGGPATAALLNTPATLAIDAAGNLFIADYSNYVIRKINTTGVISTVAGTGVSGNTGDGSPATVATIGLVNGIAVDLTGNLYMALGTTNIIRKVNSAGIISRFAGNLSGGFAGDGAAATAATLNQPADVKTDMAGNVYIADASNRRIRRVNSAGIISTIAGTGFSGYNGEGVAATVAQFNSPGGLWLDNNSNLYIADLADQRVRKISPVGIAISAASSTICQGIPVLFTDPTPGGIWSSSNTAVVAVGSSTGVVTGVAAGTATITYTFGFSCGAPYVVQPVTVNAFDAGVISGPSVVCAGNTITLTDAASGGVWSSSAPSVATVSSSGLVTGVAEGNVTISYTITGSCGSLAARQQIIVGAPVITTFAGTGVSGSLGDGGAATSATFLSPHSICTDAAGNIYIADPSAHKIRKVSPAGIITTFAGTGAAGSTGDGGPATNATFQSAFMIISDAAGNIYFSDNTSNKIRKINTSGIISTIAGTGGTGFFGDGGQATAALMNSPSGIGFDATGNLYISDGNNQRIRKVNTSGIISTIAGTGGIGATGDGGPATAASFHTPNYLRLDAAGNIYVTDNGNHKIRKITPLGTITTFAGTGVAGSSGNGAPATAAQLNFPGGVAIDGAGNVYIAGDVTQDIRVVNTAGIISNYAGTGVLGYSGDDGLPSAAKFNIPVDVVFDNNGNLLIADLSNYVVRKIAPVPTTVAPVAGPTNVCVGSNITLTDATSGGTWSSGSTAIATVNSSGVVTGVSAGVVTISYSLVFSCGTVSSVQTVTVDPLPVTPGPITGPANLCLGSPLTLTDPVIGGTWSSTVPAVATIGSASGIVTGISAGTTVFSYTETTSCGSLASVLTVNVLPAPVAISGTTVLCAGATTTLSDIGSGTWTSSNVAVASIGSSSGLVNALTPGVTTITYTLSGICSTTTNVTVNPMPAAITPATPVAVCVGATAILGDVTTGGTWSSGSLLIATIGTSGTVTGVAPGSATISYTLPGGCAVTKVVSVHVTPAAISPSSAVVCTGNTTTLSETVGGGIWTSTAPAIASVSGGVVTGLTVGTASISYTIGSCAVGIPVTVNLSPAAGSISGPSTLCTGAPITYTDAAPGGTWSSSNNAIVTINSSGLATAVSGGVATISYSVTNSCGTAVAVKTVTVSVAASAGTIIGTTLVCAGNTTAYVDTTSGGVWSVTNSNATISATGIFTALIPGIDTVLYTVTNGCGSFSATKIVTIGLFLTAGTISGPSSVCVGSTITLTDPATGGVWSSSNSSASVAGGVVTGMSAGTDTISYTVTSGCGSVVATQIISVIPIPVSGTVTGPVIRCAGTTTTYTDAAPGGVWAMTNPLATISSGGVVTTLAPGIDTITYTVANSCGTAVSSLAITIGTAISAGTIAGPGSVCVGASIVLTDASPGGSWSASNGNATVFGGNVMGVSPGLDTISYTVTSGCGSVSAQAVVLVNPLPDAGAISGPANLCIGTPFTYSDPAPGGVWSSSNTSATVSTAGVVTPLFSGTDTISYSVTNSCGTATAIRIIAISVAPDAGTIVGASSVCVGASVSLTDAAPGGVWSASNANATVSGGMVTGVSGGLDTISYAVSSVCGTATAVKVIAINTIPSAGSITGPGAVCLGAPITLTDAVPGGVWSSSNASASITAGGVVTANVPGTDTISYTVSNGCGTAVATQVVAVSIAAPDAGTISGPSTVCSGASITLADAAPGGTWSASNANAVVAGGMVTGVAVGVDTIFYSVTNGCGTSITNYVVTIGAALTTGSISGPSAVCIGATITLSDPVTGGVWSSSNSNATVSGGMVSGIAVGVDTISYTVTGACGSASAVKIITVGVAPSAGTITGPTGVCAGGSIVLADATAGGVWSASNSHALVAAGTVTGITAGLDTIRYTVTSTCGTAVAAKVISVNSLPSPGTITGAASVCPGGTIALSHSVTGGVWGSSNTTVATISGSGIVTGVSSGTSIISYTVSNSCGHASATHGITVLTPASCGGVGVNNVPGIKTELLVAPNPNGGVFTMNLQSDLMEDVTVIITNAVGEKVKELKTRTNTVVDLNIGDATGFYLLTATTSTNRYVAKVIIN